jgi:hypothetical protein
MLKINTILQEPEDQYGEEYIQNILSLTTITATYDEIIISIPVEKNTIVNDSFNLGRINGYKHEWLPAKAGYRPNKYAAWQRDRYTNLETGNLVYLHQNKWWLRLLFNHEGEKQLTFDEISHFKQIVISKYCQWLNQLINNDEVSNKIKPYIYQYTEEELQKLSFVSYIETAINFKGNTDIYFLLNELKESMYIKYTRKENAVGGNGKGVVKRSGHILYNSIESFYLGSKNSPMQFIFYHKLKLDDREKLFRIEMKFRRKYFKKHGIITEKDIDQFKPSQIWRNRVEFFDVDHKKVQKRLNKLKLPDPLDLPNKDCYQTVKNLTNNPKRYRIPKWIHLNNAIINAIEDIEMAYKGGGLATTIMQGGSSPKKITLTKYLIYR